MSGLGMPELIIILCLGVTYVPLIFYLLTLSKTLSVVSEKNRTMSPGLVWLNLIPVFVLGWHLYTVVMIRNSLRAEFQERNIADPGKGGFGVGMATSVLFVSSVIPYVGMVTGIAGLVFWIIYWVKIAGYKKRLLIQDQTGGVNAVQPD